MPPSPSTFFALLIVLTYLEISISTSYSQKISNETILKDSCPLNFDILRKLVSENPARFKSSDITIQCRDVLEGMYLVQSEYLQRNGYFVPPPTTSEACWESYKQLMVVFLDDFDIETSCGYRAELIFKSCKNITSRAEFESLIPQTKLNNVSYFCSHSLENGLTCGRCNNRLIKLRTSYLNGINDTGNISACSRYPNMYTAAFVNQFGPTDKATAKCLFSLEFKQERSSNRHRQRMIAAVVFGSFAGLLGAVAAVIALLIRRHKKNRMKKSNVVMERNDSIKEETSLIFGFGLYSRSPSLRKFKIEEIKRATMNFSRSNIVGMGGYGNVYKGVLPDGSEVAIKRFKNCSVVGDANFVHEVEVIASVKHVNLVALRGFCTATVPLEGHQRIIVCDLIHNGSLYDHLFLSGKKKLGWAVRQKIALGTARGIDYLHYGLNPAIIHRDIKASNILLDETFEPKVADFGLAKIKSEGKTHLSTRVAGTLGYVAPEYALYGKLTEKSDVFSFGVVLLELLSGKKAYSEDEGKIFLLTDWAWELVLQGKALDVIEQGMPEMGLPEVMEQYVLIAALCSHPILDVRPTMDQIVKIMETGFPNLPIPSATSE